MQTQGSVCKYQLFVEYIMELDELHTSVCAEQSVCLSQAVAVMSSLSHWCIVGIKH